MGANLADVRLRRDQALKTMSVVLVRKLLIDDFEALLKEIEGMRHGNGASKAEDNPSESEWRIEEYFVYRDLKSGHRAKYSCKRKVTNQDGKKIVRHIKGSCKRVE